MKRVEADPSFRLMSRVPLANQRQHSERLSLFLSISYNQKKTQFVSSPVDIMRIFPRNVNSLAFLFVWSFFLVAFFQRSVPKCYMHICQAETQVCAQKCHRRSFTQVKTTPGNIIICFKINPSRYIVGFRWENARSVSCKASYSY